VQAGEKLAPDMPVYSIVNLSELTWKRKCRPPKSRA
jgi:hypothetical protein